jgi:hypothetical protein
VRESTDKQGSPLDAELSILGHAWCLSDGVVCEPVCRELAGTDLDVAVAQTVSCLAAGVTAGKAGPGGSTAGQHSRAQDSITAGGLAACGVAPWLEICLVGTRCGGAECCC